METTGVDPQTCDIIEFAAVLDDLNDIRPINLLPKFHCYFAKDSFVGEPFALSMHGDIFRRIAGRSEEFNRKQYNYCSAEKFGNSFKTFLVKNGYKEEHDKVAINAAGKNFGSFDLQFLKHKTDFLKHINVRSRILDPGILYVNNNDESIPGMSECKKRAGLNEEVSHNAMDDAFDVVNLIRYAMITNFKIFHGNGR